MTPIQHEIGIASQIGTYSDAVEVGPDMRWLISSGTPGLGPDGKIPQDIAGQAQVAWENVLRLLRKADMDVRDLVKVSTYLTRASDIPGYAKVRSSFLGELKPAFMLLVVPQLVWPELLVEIEVTAAKALGER
jgi:enamine deaminase RidA (YjgF/YER057c/UK114 family)